MVFGMFGSQYASNPRVERLLTVVKRLLTVIDTFRLPSGQEFQALGSKNASKKRTEVKIGASMNEHNLRK